MAFCLQVPGQVSMCILIHITFQFLRKQTYLFQVGFLQADGRYECLCCDAVRFHLQETAVLELQLGLRIQRLTLRNGCPLSHTFRSLLFSSESFFS